MSLEKKDTILSIDEMLKSIEDTINSLSAGKTTKEKAMELILNTVCTKSKRDKTPSVYEISLTIVETIDNLTAKIIDKSKAIIIIRDIVSAKEKRLKILDGDNAKALFSLKMGKSRLKKFYPLLIEAEREPVHNI